MGFSPTFKAVKPGKRKQMNIQGKQSNGQIWHNPSEISSPNTKY